MREGQILTEVDGVGTTGMSETDLVKLFKGTLSFLYAASIPGSERRGATTEERRVRGLGLRGKVSESGINGAVHNAHQMLECRAAHEPGGESDSERRRGGDSERQMSQRQSC